MIKIKYASLVRHTPKLICIALSFIVLFTQPKEIAEGIKKGFVLLGEKIIPALFPFMILSSYISASSAIQKLAMFFSKVSLRLFKVNGYGIIVVILGFLGGYPIGAKTLCKYYEESKLTKNEVFKLFPWCVNPGPAFTITAVGTFMLGSTKAGIIIYLSIICASVSVGLFSKYTKDFEAVKKTPLQYTKSKPSLVNSVSSATNAMLSICGWVLIFSAITSSLNVLIKNESIKTFINCISEVTTGCNTLLEKNASVPIVCASLAFGGLAVIFQVAPYLEKCDFGLKNFICWRIINSALSAFYCAQFLKLFPVTIQVCKVIPVGPVNFFISHNFTAAIILIITCIVFVLEVDYKKKVC